MGNQINQFCVNESTLQMSTNIKVDVPRHVQGEKDLCFELSELHPQEQDFTPLKQFIQLHQNQAPLLASNNLHSTSKIEKQSPNHCSPEQKVGKLKPKITLNFPKQGNKDVRKSLDLRQTQSTSITSDKSMEDCYGRIIISQQNFIHLRKDNIKQCYKFQEIVGEGGFGSVYRAICLKSKQERAIKVIKKQNLCQDKTNQMLEELQLLKKLDHPNIIRLYQVFQSQQEYLIVTQLCKGGSIIDFIKSRKRFDQIIIKVILKQLLYCLNYLHSMHIVHRDIKLENVVFTKKIHQRSPIEEIEIKLLDFGTACKISMPKVRCKQLIGTISYMAPEIIHGYFTSKSDLWSCGVVMYILITSKSPFKSKKREETFQKIQSFSLNFEESCWDKVSDNAKMLLIKLLEKDPNKRLSANQALRHHWFRDLDDTLPKDSDFLKKIQHYDRQNNLISVLESYLIFAKVSQEERKSISEIFRQIDKNCDGQIEKSQLIHAFKEFYPQNQKGSLRMDEIEYIVNKIDKDQSGKINLNEFSSVMVSRDKLFVKDALLDAFDFIDSSRSGYIQKKQLTTLLQGSNKSEIENLFKQLDTNHDQHISKEEFLAYLLKKGCLH